MINIFLVIKNQSSLCYDNDDDDNDKLFFKIWRNQFLNFSIFQHLKLYKNNRKVIVNSINELKEYPYREYIEKLIYNSTELIECKGILPTSTSIDNSVLKSITFSKFQLAKIKSWLIPDGVIKIKYPRVNYNEEIDYTSYPSSVTNIKNFFIKGPLTLSSIPQPYNHNNTVNGLVIGLLKPIPENIKYLKFTDSFNTELFPPLEETTELVELNLGETFSNNGNPIKKGCIPNGIKKLVINGSNGYAIPFSKDVIPSSLETLIWKIHHARTKLSVTKDILPENLTILSLNGGSMAIDIYRDSLPKNLKKLSLNASFVNIGSGSLPKGLLHLTVSNVVNQVNNNWLPNSIETLIIPLSNIRTIIQHINIPSSLKHLEFDNIGFGHGDTQILTSGCLPSKLKYLKVGNQFNQFLVKNSIPSSLNELHLGQRYNKPLEIDFVQSPSSLTKLTLSTEFNQIIEPGSLPNSITHLVFGLFYNKPFKHSSSILPTSLKTLEFNCPKYTHPIDIPNFFPPSLTNLIISKKLKDLIESHSFSKLPINITYI